MTGDELWTLLRKAEWDENKHPRDHGKFSASEGAPGSERPMHERTAPGGDLHERATASLRDHAFVQEHYSRLSRAGDEVRAKHPGREATDEVHNAAQAGIHAEAMRIHAEQDAHGGDAHLREAADEARSVARSLGNPLATQHDMAMVAISEEKRSAAEAQAERENEDRAIAAGHVSTTARDIADKYMADHEAHQRTAEDHAARLDQAHHEAAQALAALHEYSSDEHEDFNLEHATPGLHEGFRESQLALHEALGKGDVNYEHESHQRELPEDPELADHSDTHGFVPHPDNSGHELSSEEYDRQLAAHEEFMRGETAKYNQVIDEHRAEFTRRATAAQDALERLHEHQVAAHTALKESAKASGRAQSDAEKQLDKLEPEHLVNHEAFAHHERTAGGDIADEHAAEAYSDAHDAAQSMIDHAASRISEHSFDASEALEPLKGSSRATRDAIKELAKITGRAARLPVKPRKSNRPGAGAGASVWGMPAPAPARYKLKLTKLDFLSLVDTPAQETAAIRLVKRKDGDREMDATLHARVVKVTEGDDPLLYCWAFTCTGTDGQPYHDLQGDAITPDFIKAAEAFIAAGGAVDEMHDGAQKSRIAFAYPMDPDIAKAMLGEAAGAAVKQSGLMVAIRPTAEQLAKVRSGEFTGVSIAGTGVRELVKAAAAKCPGCGAYGKADSDGNCPKCGKAMKRARRAAPSAPTTKAVWTTADIDALPDSSFLYVEGGGSKDTDGKTTPRSLRHFPYKDAAGKIDLDHLRNAISRIPQSSLSKDLRDKLQVRAEKLLAAQHDKAAKRLRKQAVLTSAVDGHQHQIDLDDPADGWSDQLTTSYNTSDGADSGHCHAWVYDEAGKITIAEDSGHTHAVDAVVPDDVIRQAALNESGERCPGCGQMCEAGCRFCPQCGCAMDRRDAVPTAPMSDDDSGSGPAVVVISARAPAAISTLAPGVSTVKGNTEESTTMPDLNARIQELEAANARLQKMATLTDAQRTHHQTLLKSGSETDAANFLNLSPPQRDAMLAEIAKSDEVVYTSVSTGRVYRKSAPVELIEAAQAADASIAMTKRAEEKERDLEFAKRATNTIPNCRKGAKGDVGKRIMKALGAEFTDPAEYAEAELAMKQYEAAFAQLTVTKGHGGFDDPGETPSTPKAQLDKLTADYAKANNIPVHKAYAAVLETPAGAALYAKLPVGHA